MARESELTLVVVSERPEDVVDRVAGLPRIGAYRLSSPAEVQMHDTYYGHRGNEFDERQMALRLREVGAKTWVTVKGPVVLDRNGVRERLELELPWSRDTLDQALAVLSSNRLRLTQDDLFEEDSPEHTMTKLGFRPIQQRQNRRLTRDVVSDPEPAQALAGLAIDTVVYELGLYRIRHCEIEVESKSERGKRALATICSGLCDMFGELRRWEFGKLATGMAIEELLRRKKTGARPGQEYRLKPEDYDIISRQLGRT